MIINRLLTGHTAAMLGLVLTVSACDSNEPEDTAGDQEFITRVTLRMTNAAVPADVVTITATDADGDGGGLVFSPARATLRPGATYRATITLDDTINDESITDGISAEAEEHLFRYAFTPAITGTVTLTDRESTYGAQTGADLPVGLAFSAAVAGGATGTGTLNATLFHFGDAATKTSATSTSDERDIDIDFPVTFATATRATVTRATASL